jgi:hypothetical protein
MKTRLISNYRLQQERAASTTAIITSDELSLIEQCARIGQAAIRY